MSLGEIKTDLFPERLRAGRKNGEHGKYAQKEAQSGICKNVLISVETVGEDRRKWRDEKKETSAGNSDEA